jgi:hypothetical protein
MSVENEVVEELENDPPVDPVEVDDAIVPDEGEKQDEPAPDDDGEVEIAIDGVETKPEKEPNWVNEIRRQNREKDKAIRELTAKLQQVEQAGAPKEPKLIDFDFDEDAYKAAMVKWVREQGQAEAKQLKAKEAEQARAREWAQKQAVYESRKKELKVADYANAEDLVMGLFDDAQKAVVMDIFDKPELLVYALGKNPELAEKLAGQKNYAKFIKDMTLLETKLTVKPKTPATKPETRVNGSAPSLSSQGTLDKLMEQAGKTGDFTPVHQYKQKMKSQERK